MNGQEVLLAAADLLEKEGWTQGTYGSCSTGRCAMGALYSVTDGDDFGEYNVPALHEATFKLMSYTNDILTMDAVYPGMVIAWNDKSDQTKEKVIKTMRAAAA